MSTRILVVDDAPSVTGVVQFVLEDVGYEVEIADDGRTALVAIAARRPDLILLDLGVPGIDGYEILARLRDDPATAVIPVVLLTGTQETASSQRLAGYPVRDVILKPFSPRALVERVGKALL